MLRLSQKAWNNVVILAMLFMVYLFTLSNDMINDGDEVQHGVMPLFPPYSVIMSIDFGILRLERIGQDWRLKGNLTTDIQALIGIAENWTQLNVQRTAMAPKQSAYIVAIQLAGEDKKRVFQLFPNETGILLQANGVFYANDKISAEALYPVSLATED